MPTRTSSTCLRISSIRPGGNVIALVLFLAVGACLALIAEGLHSALQAAQAAQRTTALLLDEMSHRVKNKFAMVSSIISLQARRSSPDVQKALEDVARRVNVIATVHNHLQLMRREGLIDMSEYVPKLCGSLKEALLGSRAISLEAKAVAIKLPPDKALSIGVIVNELVTNAIKYAFREEGSGRVVVDLTRKGNELVLRVEDNGRGYPTNAQPGLGSRLVTTFATQLGGVAAWDAGACDGCAITVVFPTS